MASYAVSQKKSCVLIGRKVFERLSPLQQKIILELALQPLTLAKLSEKTGSSIYTVGKQLSLLQFRTKYNSLQKKGISKPLVKKNKGEKIKTTYFLIANSGSKNSNSKFQKMVFLFCLELVSSAYFCFMFLS